MENKPIVTCHGEQELFSSIHAELVQGLPREAVEWRRSYGRAPKMIHVDVNFVPYNSDLLPSENDRKLLQLPVFHMYWTECPDADAYKVCVKNDIAAWQQSLKEHNVSDWLIVLVETANPKRGNKQKFLPRTSVLDKIKNDFCSKQSDRVIVLHEPNNPVPTPRAQDSQVLFLQRLRSLILLAYNRVLGRFEELIRAERESRNNKDWNFCQYFLLQEELAFMFETLRQFEDALVQYDELDALFSQFIINSSAGATPKWLSDFQAPCHCWDGLNLSKPVNMDKRELLERGKPTLLDVRNYLFSRQAALLFLLKRPWEVAYRAQNFMHNCVQELKILEVSMPEGSIACWVFLSCLEVLQKCERSSDAAHINTYSHYTASLWLYAQKKLHELGLLAGLMPDTAGPTSEQLNSVVDLLSGMGQTAEIGARENSPNQMLREALSSQEAFTKHYLELSELAMGTFKHIGRMRSARLIGQDLAKFYMKTGELHKAETFLSDALRIYEKEAWPWLVASTRKDLAECHKKLDNKEKYLKLCCQIAAEALLPESERQAYYEEMKRLTSEVEQSEDAGDSKSLIPLDTICALPALSVDPADGHVGKEEAVSIKVTFTSHLPAPITIDLITLQLHDQSMTGGVATDGQPMGMEKSPSQDSLQRLRNLEAVSRVREKGGVGVTPDFQSEVKMAGEVDIELSTLVCRNAQALLQRQDSSSSLGRTKDVVVKETCSRSLTLEHVEMQPGRNVVEFEFKSEENGTFQVRQLVFKINNAEFLANTEDCPEIEVFSKEAQLSISSKSGLLSGIPQVVNLGLTTGHSPVATGTSLAITTPAALSVLPSKKEEYEVESSPEGGSIQFLQDVKSYSEIALKVCIVAEMGRQTAAEREEKENIQFSVECPWSETVMTTLEFSNPFTFHHKIYTAGQRKFLQVSVQSCGRPSFELSNGSLEVRGERSLTLTPSFRFTSIPLQPGKTVSYLWEAKPCTESWPFDMTSLQFSVIYRPLDLNLDAESADTPDDSTRDRTSFYDFDIENYQTLFEITSIIKPPQKEELCKAGTLCSLDVTIKILDTPTAVAMANSSGDTPTNTPLTPTVQSVSSLMYEIDTDGGMWAVCGRSTGVVTMPTKGSEITEVTLEVIPLVAGFLPMPAIRLSQYMTGVQAKDGKPMTETNTTNANNQASHHHSNSSDRKPTILPFRDSQVYYRSKACQIRVLPECNLSTVEVAVS
ncbi:trafficking protein particle complex subunit 10-like [Diadema antillarum]|uniref:trafficking protein particle complex subunit 10-like n=1 Tax=Diadema antillarum TaxID=105358 RepID=UPI003A8BE5F2